MAQLIVHKEYDTVTLKLQADNTTEKKKYHCYKCGRTCFMYYGQVFMIFFGDVVEETIIKHEQPIEAFCYGCKIAYKIL